MKFATAILLLLACALCCQAQMPTSGDGTATVYDTSSYQAGVGACNCKTGISNYPTAALSQYYFGVASGQGAGPACGKCFKLTVTGDPYSSWCPTQQYSLVVKVADLCPAVAPNMDWCAATATTNNKFGVKAHFDINEATAAALTASGLKAFKVKFCEVSCTQWAGYNDANAYGQASTTWGSCPRDVSGGVASASQCAAATTCSGPAPTPAPTPAPSTTPSFVWNSNSNDYWFAVRITPKPSKVEVLCSGANWVALDVPSWDANSWESNNHCPGTFSLRLNGNQVISNVKLFSPSSGTYSLQVSEDDSSNSESTAAEDDDESNDDVETDSKADEDVEANENESAEQADDDEEEAWTGSDDDDLDALLASD